MSNWDRLKKLLFKDEENSSSDKPTIQKLDLDKLDYEPYVKTKRKKPTERQVALAKKTAGSELNKQTRAEFAKNLEDIANSKGDINSILFKDPKLFITDDKSDDKGLKYRLKSMFGNTAANFTTSPLSLSGFLGSVLTYPVAKIHSKLTGGPDDIFWEMAGENPITKTGEAIERKIRDKVGIAQYEDMDKTDQMINLASMFIGPSAAKGDKFLKAILKPGLQVTKDASKLVKAGQIGSQVALPAAMNEALRFSNKQEGIIGDYREPDEENNVNLLLAQRSNASGDEIYEAPVNLDEDIKPLDEQIKSVAKTAAKVVAPVAALAAVRHTKLAKNIVSNIKLAETTRKNAIKFSDTLTLGDKVINSIDTKNITDKLLEKGMITEQTANNLYRNTYTQTKNLYDTGSLYVGDKLFQLDNAPRWITSKVQFLSKRYPEEYEKFNMIMNNARLLQAKLHEYNKANKTNLSISDMLSNPDLGREINIFGKNFNNVYRDTNKLYENLLKNNSEFRTVFQDISKINDKVIDIALETGELSEEFADKLRKNRNIFDLNLYLPGVQAPQEFSGVTGYFQKIKNRFSNKSMYKTADPFAFKLRSDISTVENAANWDISFQNNFENTIKTLLDNRNKRLLVKDLLANRDKGIKGSLNSIKELQDSMNFNNIKENQGQIDELSKNISSMFDNISYVGEEVVEEGKYNSNTNQLLDVLNKKSSELSKNEFDINSKIGHYEKQDVSKAAKNFQNKAEYIAIPEDNKIKYYKVDDYIGQIVQLDPQNAGIIYNGMRGLTNLVKSTITGTLNPFYSPITTAYTATDQLTGLRSINKALGTNYKKSSIVKKYLTDSAKQSFNYKRDANKLNNIYKALENGKINYTDDVKNTINTLEKRIQDNEITQLKAAGANVQGRYPVNVHKQKAVEANSDDIGFVVNSQGSLNNLIDTVKNSKLIDNAAINGATNGLKYVNFTLQSLRDVPTLGFYKTFSPVFKDANGKLDTNKVMQISRLLDKHTATGALTPAQNTLGKVVQGSFDSIAYLSDMFAENIARGNMMNFGNIKQHFVNLIDKDVSLQKELKSIAKGITGNDFVKAGLSVTAAPVMLSSLWNHATEENERAYDVLPDNFKNKGIVFANVINGQPIVIPFSQSLMWFVTGLRDGIMDNALRINQNTYNYGDTFKHRLMETGSINWSVNLPVAASLLSNAGGYRVNNATDMIKDALEGYYVFEGKQLTDANNERYKDTYYENGLFSPKQRAMVQTLFGNPGSSVVEAIDVAKNKGSLTEGIEAGVSKYLTTLTNLVNPKASIWSNTSNILYKKDDSIKKLPKDDKLTPEAVKVKQTILQYRNSRLTPIKDKIKEYKKQITNLKNVGKVDENSEYFDYFGSQPKINEITKQIKLLQSQQLKEYETLDKLLKQYYNTTLDEFIKGVK